MFSSFTAASCSHGVGADALASAARPQASAMIPETTAAAMVRFSRQSLVRIDAVSASGDIYLRPSFFPAARSSIDSRMRFSRVSGRFAV